MRTQSAVATVFAIVALGWIATLAAPQNAQAVPGVGNGVVQVSGTVNVGNTPKVEVVGGVQASQQGEWKVVVSNQPSVIVALPAFVRAGVVYDCLWPSGEREVLRVGSVAAGGWVKVEGKTVRWVNISLARSLEEK